MLGREFVTWRKSAGLTQDEAALAAGISPRTVMRAEKATGEEIPEALALVVAGGKPAPLVAAPVDKSAPKVTKLAPPDLPPMPAYRGTREQAGAPKNAERATDAMRRAFPGRFNGPNVWFVRHMDRANAKPGDITMTVYRGSASGVGASSMVLYGFPRPGCGIMESVIPEFGNGTPGGRDGPGGGQKSPPPKRKAA